MLPRLWSKQDDVSSILDYVDGVAAQTYEFPQDVNAIARHNQELQQAMARIAQTHKVCSSVLVRR